MNAEEQLRETTIRHVNEYFKRMTMEEVIQIADVTGRVIVRLINEDNEKLNNRR